MEFKFLFLLLSIMTVTTPQGEEIPMSEHTRIFNNVLHKGAESISKKYNLRHIGGGGSAFGGPIKSFALTFTINGELTKEQLRKILIESSKDFLEIINSDAGVQKFLVKRPFIFEDIDIVIFNHDKNGRELCDPMISSVETFEGNIVYETMDNVKPFLYKHRYEETYEEALEILKKEKQLKDS